MDAQLTPEAARAMMQREIGSLPELVRQLQGQARAFARGVATVAWPGGSPVSSLAIVPHRLGRAPTGVQLTAMGFASANAHVALEIAPDATNIEVRARTLDGSSPAAATTCGFMWEARL